MLKELFSEIPYLENEYIILKSLTDADSQSLEKLRKNKSVYRYLPTFLFEQQIEDVHRVINEMYESIFKNKESLLLGIYLKKDMSFCGLAEFYGYRPEMKKISLGYRLLEEFWGRGIATNAVSLMVDYIYGETDIVIITASTMVENEASANVLRKNDFIQTVIADEDWGFADLTTAYKWFR